MNNQSWWLILISLICYIQNTPAVFVFNQSNWTEIIRLMQDDKILGYVILKPMQAINLSKYQHTAHPILAKVNYIARNLKISRSDIDVNPGEAEKHGPIERGEAVARRLRAAGTNTGHVVFDVLFKKIKLGTKYESTIILEDISHTNVPAKIPAYRYHLPQTSITAL